MRIPREVQERFARICESVNNSYITLFECRNELFNLLQQVRGEIIELPCTRSLTVVTRKE
jgi:uncharacterized protein Yka (UPF0111/DUF47 family)